MPAYDSEAGLARLARLGKARNAEERGASWLGTRNAEFHQNLNPPRYYLM